MVDETLADAATSRPSFGAGTQLGKYKLLRLLGEGGMGQVWAAHDPDLDREVALKLLRAEQAAPQLRTRLLREARAMARLKHPNVLTVYEVGSEGERDFIAMELVDGMNLDQWLATRPLRDELWHALIAAGRGLAAAHQAGLVHRDFKPHNVLRSRDGRVLVTDFGLARGVGEEKLQAVPDSLATPVALDITLDANANSDSLLDSPLTQTGALIGTPAYMAPEQYAGSPPDPRTDQFAFCVTVWQALTGERPFHGTSLDELRRATNKGVAHLQAKLPRNVRAALVRGLTPDPAKRFASMDELLRALDRPKKQWAATTAIALAAGVLIGSIAYGQLAHRNEPPPAKSPYACDPPEQAFADAWTSERRTALENRVGPGAALVAGALDELRASWMKAYATACAAPPSQATFARLGCLLGERDEAAAFTRLADTLPVTTFDQLEVWGSLPRVEMCATDSPVAPPLLPEDKKLRNKIVAMRAEIASLQLRDPQALLAKANDFEQAAQQLHWDPLMPELYEALGTAAQTTGDYERARRYVTQAADRAAQLHHYRVEAMARIEMLVIEADSTGDPREQKREERLVRDARDAVHRAGDDPELGDEIDVLVASNALGRGDLMTAEQLLAKDAWGGPHSTSRIAIAQTAQRIRLALRQSQWGAARALGRLHEQNQTQAGPDHALIEKQLVQAAWRDGDLEDAHTRADKLFDTSATKGGGTLLRVTVKDEHGTPIEGARVVAWEGELNGDGRRIYTGPDFVGVTDVTGEDGHATLMAVPIEGAVMAEHDDLRSKPVPVNAATGEATLVLAPTHSVTGRVATRTPPPALDAFVKFQVGKAAWLDRAVLAHDGSFRITGAPSGPFVAGVKGAYNLDGHVITGDLATLAWRGDATIDVVSAKPGKITITHGKNDTAQADLEPIGLAHLTPEGQKIYVAGDLHVVFHDIAAGDINVCSSATNTCITANAPAHGTIAVVIR
ncbi:MAG: serine/threonine protein kinase [Deltaproteobacteria bacterium]|nr:serine/threonine protein kinase [Deltaproteobacteria bacterium]